MCIVGELGVVRSGCRGLLRLSGEGGHIWVVLSHPLMISGTSVSATLFRVCSRGPVWAVDEYMTNVHLEMSHWRQNVLRLFEVASVRKRWAQGSLSQPATVPKLANVVLGYIP